MKVPLYKQVALLKNYPEHGLTAGDIVTTVDFLESPEVGIPNGYFVEAFNALGKTIAVFIVYEEDVEILTDDDMLRRRSLTVGDVIDMNISELKSDWLLEEKENSRMEDAITLTIPRNLVKETGHSEADVKLEIAVVLFRNQLYSLGKASEFAGLHPSQFQKELADRQLSVHYDIDEYQQDIDTLNSHRDSSPAYHGVQ